MRKTKLICTIGPACEDEQILEEMCLAGMNVARLNFSHGTHEEHGKKIELIKKVREKLNLPIPIMLDTKGPEYRIRTFRNGKVFLHDGDDFTFSLVTNELSDDCKQFNTGCGGRGLYITKSCKNVEAAYKTLAYAYSDEGMKLLMWGIEGEDYTLDGDGYPVFNYDFQGDNSVLQPRGLKYWGWLVHNNIVTSIAEANSDSQTAEDRKNLSSHTVVNPVIGMIRFETDSDEANIQAKLNEMCSNQQTNIFMADSEEACEAAFNEMLDVAKQIGMEKLDEYGNASYPELKAEYEKVTESVAK